MGGTEFTLVNDDLTPGTRLSLIQPFGRVLFRINFRRHTSNIQHSWDFSSFSLDGIHDIRCDSTRLDSPNTHSHPHKHHSHAISLNIIFWLSEAVSKMINFGFPSKVIKINWSNYFLYLRTAEEFQKTDLLWNFSFEFAFLFRCRSRMPFPTLFLFKWNLSWVACSSTTEHTKPQH